MPWCIASSRRTRPDEEAHLDAAPTPEIPYAGTLIALEPGVFDTIRRVVATLHRVAHRPTFQQRVDVDACPVARHRPPNFAVFMGYDFHLTPAGPRLIEVNTNAGGALLNGLHTASLCDPARLACLCSDLMPVETMKAQLVATFVAEHALVRPGAPLRRIAIADDRPGEQFLRAEFELFVRLFASAGVEARVCDVRDLVRSGGALMLGGEPMDLVYLRDTDWRLAEPRSRALREAYLAGEVVVTPSPREHHLLADKRRMQIFSSPALLAELGVPVEDAALLAEVVPETLLLETLGFERAWSERRSWVFKPADAFASRAVYRGDKISRVKLEEIVAQGGFIAQRRVEPGEIPVQTTEGKRPMKFDVRAYAYREDVLLLGARVYQGQVTNLRTPGGGFSAICVVCG